MFPIVEFLEYTKEFVENEYIKVDFTIRSFELRVDIEFFFLESENFKLFSDDVKIMLKYIDTVSEMAEKNEKGSILIFPSFDSYGVEYDENIRERIFDSGIYPPEVLEDIESYNLNSYSIELKIKL